MESAVLSRQSSWCSSQYTSGPTLEVLKPINHMVSKVGGMNQGGVMAYHNGGENLLLLQLGQNSLERLEFVLIIFYIVHHEDRKGYFWLHKSLLQQYPSCPQISWIEDEDTWQEQDSVKQHCHYFGKLQPRLVSYRAAHHSLDRREGFGHVPVSLSGFSNFIFVSWLSRLFKQATIKLLKCFLTLSVWCNTRFFINQLSDPVDNKVVKNHLQA